VQELLLPTMLGPARGLPTTLTGMAAEPGLITSPLCLCLVNVLNKYNAMSVSIDMSERVKKASRAFKACFSTNIHIPQQRQLLNENYKKDDIKTRKTYSKASLMLLICMSFLFNLIYSTLYYPETPAQESFYTSGNLSRIAGMVVICILQMLLPMAFQSGAHTGNLVFISALIVVPAAILQFGIMEVAWAYLRSTHRGVHIHPYVFSTTLLCLIALAHFENGVFDFGVFLYYLLISHAITLAYAATLFFAHFNNNNGGVDLHTLSGHIALFAAVTVLVISGISPAYLTSPGLGIAWVLPWVFTCIVFGLSIYLERTLENVKGVEGVAEKSAHLHFAAHTLLVAIVIGLIWLKLWHNNFGESVLPYADVVMPPLTSVNFAFGRNIGRPSQYIVG
jgi:hypothetical protein